MSFFSSLLSSAPKPSQGARLLDRLESSTQLEDRRSAIAEFNELTAAEPVRLIDKGMAVLVQLLREEDTQLTRDVLETLSNLMDPEVPRGVVAETGEVKAVHNASVFLGSDSHLLEVLNSSEDGDLYVRFHAVQLVMKLLSRARRQTQENVLNQPATVGRVLQLAEDRREIVRNEVLLLLARLGEGSAGLQNILAFQGAFEQLLSIVESEGKEEGARGRSVSLLISTRRLRGAVTVGRRCVPVVRAGQVVSPASSCTTACASPPAFSSTTCRRAASFVKVAACNACQHCCSCLRATAELTRRLPRSLASCSDACSPLVAMWLHHWARRQMLRPAAVAPPVLRKVRQRQQQQRPQTRSSKTTSRRRRRLCRCWE